MVTTKGKLKLLLTIGVVVLSFGVSDVFAKLSFPRTIKVKGYAEPLDFEKGYLKGVVQKELRECETTKNGTEALRAQAVASRCYAISIGYERRHRSDDYDVCLSQHCQDWEEWNPKLYPDVGKAVDTTEGEGLICFNDKITPFRGKSYIKNVNWIQAYFFQSCGKNGTKDKLNTPYLKRVLCDAEAKGHEKAAGYDGSGYGMCQMGAKGLASKGWNYKRILQHFYSLPETVYPVDKEGKIQYFFPSKDIEPDSAVFVYGTASFYCTANPNRNTHPIYIISRNDAWKEGDHIVNEPNILNIVKKGEVKVTSEGKIEPVNPKEPLYVPTIST